MNTGSGTSLNESISTPNQEVPSSSQCVQSISLMIVLLLFIRLGSQLKRGRYLAGLEQLGLKGQIEFWTDAIKIGGGKDTNEFIQSIKSDEYRDNVMKLSDSERQEMLNGTEPNRSTDARYI